MIVDSLARDRIVLRACAKLNLFLDVLGRRDDGYHEVATVLHEIDLADRLDVALEPGDGDRLELSGIPCPAGADNLVLRAAAAYRAAAGPDALPGLRAVLRLEKRIPLGAGLGGGSADAAATLYALDRLAHSGLGRPALEHIGAGLGSDVPFFFGGGTALCTGRGEQVAPLPPSRSPRLQCVVLYPGVAVSTAIVYRNVSLRLKTPLPHVGRFLEQLERLPEPPIAAFHNALEEPLRRCQPDLARLQDSITERTGRRFLVSGSGSAMFTTVASREEGRELERELRAVAAGVVFGTASVPANAG